MEQQSTQLDNSRLSEAVSGFGGDILTKLSKGFEEMLPYGVWICDAEGELIYVSGSFLDMLGMSFEEAKEKSWCSRLLPETIDATVKKWFYTIKSGTFWDEEHIFIDKNGKEVCVLSRGYPIKDNAGTTICWAGIHLDITDKKEMFNNIKNLNTEYSNLLERIGNSFIAFDKELNIVYMNETSAGHLSIERNKIIGKNIYEIASFIKGGIIDLSLRKALKEQERVSFRYRSERLARDFQVFLYPSKTGLTMLATDITDEVAAKKETERLIEEKELLLKELNHRTKNNLQLLSSMVSLQMNSIEDPDTKALFKQQWHRINTIGMLYDKLYNSSSVSRIGLRGYLEEIAAHLKMSFAGINGISIETDIEDIVVDNAVAVSAGLILNELLSNALKYAFKQGESGLVRVELKKTAEGRMKLLVSDNGHGPEQTEPAGKGFGTLIVRALAEQHGGEFRFTANGQTIAEAEMEF